MRFTVPLAMFGWPLVAVVLFMVLPTRRAALTAMLGGWLLLPQMVAYRVGGLPDYTRSTAIFLGIVLGIALFDASRLARIRWGLLDLPILVWCLSPLASSISYGLGVYDGVSGVVDQLTTYGAPYLIGRCCFATPSGHRELLRGVVAAGLLYSGFILLELWWGPYWHRLVYGYEHFKWHEVWRLGWYRPIAFLRTGHAQGLWSATVFVLALWHCRRRPRERILGCPSRVVAWTLAGFALMSRALNGYVAASVALGTLVLGRAKRTRLPLVLLMIVPPGYLVSRISLRERPEFALEYVSMVSEDRAASLRSRVTHEIFLIDHALERPVFGWGTYNRNRADFEGMRLPEGAMGNRSITDSLWIIAFGQKGLVGLISVYACLLIPGWVVCRCLPPRQWSRERAYAAPALAAVTLGFAFDSLANAMINPLFFVIPGAMAAPGLFASARAEAPAELRGADRAIAGERAHV